MEEKERGNQYRKNNNDKSCEYINKIILFEQVTSGTVIIHFARTFLKRTNTDSAGRIHILNSEQVTTGAEEET